MSERVRILVVDDSEIYADVMRRAVKRSNRAELVGVAVNGREGVEQAKALSPDVVSMDVHMPEMDGLDAVEHIMDQSPCPIAMVTAATSAEMSQISFRAIGSGALDVLGKPADGAEADALVRRLCVLSRVKTRRFRRSSAEAPRRADRVVQAPVATPTAPAVAPARAAQVVGLVLSTGGPPLLDRLLCTLPADYPAGVVIVQHTSMGFDGQLVEWLGVGSALDVRLATEDARVEPGVAYIAPAGRHLRVRMGGRLTLDDGERVDGHRPSGTVLLESLARSYGARAAGIVLTGMGRDGAAGLLALREAGGTTAAQDAQSSAVDGMPRTARESGAAMHVVSASELASFMQNVTRG